MDALTVLAARRDGRSHTEEEIRWLVQGAAQKTLPDYQLAAWLMAAYLNPLDEQQTVWLTQAIADFGERMDLSGLPRPWVDKHSTGGVGDKTTLVTLPILSACGLTVVKMSGRGLGITGGTIDKLESIPGFRTDLSPGEMKVQAERIGIALTGQTPDLAPADKVMYALRDVTATVGSIPLIVSSILSKKLAGGAESIVLDVKCGSGAFMEDFTHAKELAQWLQRVGQQCGLNLRVAITDMSQSLGRAAGNALEVKEAFDVLQGKPLSSPSQRFRSLCVRLSGLALAASGLAENATKGERMAEEVLTNRSAWKKAEEWFHAQGATNLEDLPESPVRTTLQAPADGWVAKLDAGSIGRVVVDLGGGRKKKEDSIDPGVGIEVHAIVAERVLQGQPLVTIHAANEEAARNAEEALRAAIQVSSSPVEPTALFLEVL